MQLSSKKSSDGEDEDGDLDLDVMAGDDRIPAAEAKELAAMFSELSDCIKVIKSNVLVPVIKKIVAEIEERSTEQAVGAQSSLSIASGFDLEALNRPLPGGLLDFVGEALRELRASSEESKDESSAIVSTVANVHEIVLEAKAKEERLRSDLKSLLEQMDELRPVSSVEAQMRLSRLAEPFDLLEEKCSESIQLLLEDSLYQESTSSAFTMGYSNSSRFSKGGQKVLYDWLKTHFDHPYPKFEEKKLLAEQAGITLRQLTQWFTNARRRIWKPFKSSLQKSAVALPFHDD